MATPTWSRGEWDPVARTPPDPRQARARGWQVAAVACAALSLVLALLLRADDEEAHAGVTAAAMACGMLDDLDAGAVTDPVDRRVALLTVERVSASQSMAWVASLEDGTYAELRDALNAPSTTAIRYSLQGSDDIPRDHAVEIARQQFETTFQEAREVCAETVTAGP